MHSHLRDTTLGDGLPIDPKATHDALDGRSMAWLGVDGDGQWPWTRVDFPSQGTLPQVTRGVLAPVAGANEVEQFLSSPPSGEGWRWIARAVKNSYRDPAELYVARTVDGEPSRRVDLTAIREQMPDFVPLAPFSNWQLMELDIDGQGRALALVWYFLKPYPSAGARISLLRWDGNATATGIHQPESVWSIDIPYGYPHAARDAQKRMWFIFPGRIVRYTEQGALDASFAVGGNLDLSEISDYNDLMSLVPLPQGGAWIYLEGYETAQGTGRRLDLPPEVIRLDDAGSVAAKVYLTTAPENQQGARTLLAGPENSLLLIHNVDRSEKYRVLRIKADGALDMGYGLRGAEKMALPGVSWASPPVLRNLSDQRILNVLYPKATVYRYDPAIPGPTGATKAVVEFHNAILDHYFMTSDPVEIAWIERGEAGPGWARTGQTFNTFLDLAEAPGDALEVCRFYGDQGQAPGYSPNGKRGPNSHFYTFAGHECTHVYSTDAGWLYEGLRLTLLPTLPDKSCPAGQTPVLRAYNNGYEVRNGTWVRNDANHRYSTSSAIMNQMAAQGWSLEGTRFCAPE